MRKLGKLVFLCYNLIKKEVIMTQEELLKLIEYIEDEDMVINPKWYYHASRYDKEKYKNILTKGILSAYLRKDDNHGKTNGRYYVCVARNMELDTGNLLAAPGFVIDEKLKTLNASKFKIFELFEDTILPFRYCDGDEDERQVFLKINKSKIIALQYAIKKWAIHDYMDDRPVRDIQRVKELFNIMDSLNIDLPIYDFSSRKEINKEKVMKLDI